MCWCDLDENLKTMFLVCYMFMGSVVVFIIVFLIVAILHSDLTVLLGFLLGAAVFLMGLKLYQDCSYEIDRVKN